MAATLPSIVVALALVGSVEQTAKPPAGTAAPPAGAAAPTPVAVPGDYIIGPEDVLGIVLWRETELSGDVTVRPDGRITVPVIGEIQAAGLAPDALRQQVQKAAQKFIADPNVSVVVRAINSRKIYVTGMVPAPGAHSLVGPLTVLQALALSGGVNEYADSKNITILRNVDGRQETLKFNYKDVARGRRLEQNIQLKPGDTIVVP